MVRQRLAKPYPRKGVAGSSPAPSAQLTMRTVNPPSLHSTLFVLFVCLSVITLLWSFKLQLVSTDLGRHLQNGRVLFQDKGVLYTNFYSFTFPSFYFQNHHWLSGVFFYLVYKVFSFGGLQALFILLVFITFYLFWKTSLNFSSSLLAGTLAIPSLVILSERQELRPELFTYLFLGTQFYIWWKVKNNEFSSRILWVLPFLQALWANLHILFWTGLGLQFLFFVDALLNHKLYVKKLFFILLSSVIASMLTPFGIHNLAYPFFLVNNYGYRILENQSLFFVQKRLPSLSALLFEIEVLLLSVLIVFGFKEKTLSLKKDFLMLTLAMILPLAGILVYRNIFLVAWFLIPLISYFLYRLGVRFLPETLLIILFIELFVISVFVLPLKMAGREWGWGPERSALQFMEFSQKTRLPGKIFNNYDLGSFLIFSLFPEQRVFVDNRPEAYPVSFFEEYILAQKDLNYFKKMAESQGIESVVFYWHDLTPWAQSFLTRIVYEPDWVPVFANSKIVVLVKNTPENQELIDKFGLPRDIFGVKKIVN